MNVVMLGATRGMGRALARRFAERGERIFLLENDAAQLERSVKDLEIRGAAGSVRFAFCDLLNPETFASAVDAAFAAMGRVDAVVVTAALFGTQKQLEDDPQFAARLLAADFTNTILFCENVRKRLLAQGGGTLCAFSSVAGDRGRKPVILYGAAKAGLSRYLEGLDHKFRSQGLKTVCVKPGFVKTGMTVGLKPPPFTGDMAGVSKLVLQAIDRGVPVVYAPKMWKWVMWVICRLPRMVMRKVEF
jgi:NAD(P)-dependent dehydrogenase (short-subunit alcohol dehydrogenase family)